MKKIMFNFGSELGKRNARASKQGQGESKQLFHMEQLTRQQIERDFHFFGSIIPASSADYDRRRTAYFYRKQAIECARDARWHKVWFPSLSDTLNRLAKSYLANFRQMKGAK